MSTPARKRDEIINFTLSLYDTVSAVELQHECKIFI